MFTIDLNCDLGEGFGKYKSGDDENIIPFISSANIACGFHAGDAVIMTKTVKLCKKYNVAIGAHPSFPDLQGFGRRKMDCSPDEVKAFITYQIGALKAICEAQNVKLHHVKPHGALYNMAVNDIKLADAICSAIKECAPDVKLLALSGSQMIKSAQNIGLATANEVFADRAYTSDSKLVPRGITGAVLEDENIVIDRVKRMITEKKVKSIDNIDLALKPDSICVHSDTKNAVDFIKRIHKMFKNQNIQMKTI